MRGASGSTVGATAVSNRMIRMIVGLCPAVRVVVRTAIVVVWSIARVGTDVARRKRLRRRRWVGRQWRRRAWERKRVTWTVATVLRAWKSIGHVVVDAVEGVKMRRGA